jgi:hypothetical protein
MGGVGGDFGGGGGGGLICKLISVFIFMAY